MPVHVSCIFTCFTFIKIWRKLLKKKKKRFLNEINDDSLKELFLISVAAMPWHAYTKLYI